MTASPWLAASGAPCAAAPSAHFTITVGGPRRHDFFGGRPRMVRISEPVSPKAALISPGIAAVLVFLHLVGTLQLWRT